jgi:hypothetical protein
MALGNQNGSGIEVDFLAGGTIGGTVAGAGNLISGNHEYGIAVDGGITTIQGNWIGTAATGTAAVGNGVGIGFAGLNSTVGGTVAGAGNVISGNRDAGIMSYGGLVEGNRIGTDSTGTYALANGGDGIDSFGSGTIGGNSPGAGNLISGNTGNGIGILGIFGSVLVQGNLIGVDASGTNALGNGGHGMLVSGAGSTIGGTVAGTGNVIAFNGGDGVRVDGSNGNAVWGNAIYGHTAGLGIRLVNNGNYNRPAPVLTDARSRVSGVSVTGTLTSRANSRFTLEFFGNSDCNPSGYGEGQVFLGSLAVMTDAAGNGSFTAHLGAVVDPGQYLTATATDSSGNTSQFSQCVVVRGHGHRGNIDRTEVPLSDRAAALLGWPGDHLDDGVGGTLMHGHRAPVRLDTAAVMVAGEVDQALVVPAAGEEPPARFCSDLFFSSLDRDEADSSFQGEASAGPLDWAWESALSWTGGLRLECGPVAMLP